MLEIFLARIDTLLTNKGLVIWDNFNKGYVDDSVRGMMHNMIVAAVAPMQPVLENVLLADKPICCATKLNVSMLLCTSEFDIARQRHALSDQIATTLYSIYFVRILF